MVAYHTPRHPRPRHDNGNGYRARASTHACQQLGIRHRRTRPCCPQTNGNTGRSIRILREGWAHTTTYPNSQARRAALPAWLHYDNHHRPHGALNRASPGQYLHQLNNPHGKYT